MTAMKVRRRITELRADCHGCTWEALNTGTREDRSVGRAARKHAAETGHKTWVESEQTTSYAPEAAS